MSARSHLVLLLAVAATALPWLCLWWVSTHQPEVPFLSSRGSARWILYPQAPRAGTRPAVELDGRFRQSFTLKRVPAVAILSLRAFRRCKVSLNGQRITFPEAGPPNWKRVKDRDVAAHLREGKNTIVVTVFNDRGPPALWLSMLCDQKTIQTDPSWQASLAGAVWEPAALASAPIDPARIDPGLASIRPVDSLRARWWILVLVAGIVAGLILAVQSSRRHLQARPGAAPQTIDRRLTAAGVAVVIFLWAILFWNNAPSLWADDGFDATFHLAYVQFILDHNRLPQADQGPAMFHPPLYYALSAAWLKLAGLSTLDHAAASVLRLQSLGFGIAQLLLLFASLRLLFPGQPRPVIFGLILAGFVPIHLYLFQLPTNETLAATLASASIYVALRLLRRGPAPVAMWACLGACLGGAMLAKLSALIVVAVLLAVLVAKHLIERSRPRPWLSTVGVTVLVCLTVCGWHYVRLWWRFGDPFIGNWDPKAMPPWWQDPGYLTASYYARFGLSLLAPLYSGLGSFADGIYSTLWGDGLLSGRGYLWLCPPWNQNQMAVGYLLALVPTLAVLIGAGFSVVQLIRKPNATGFVLLGLAAATALALILWPLKVPIYSVVKAFFGLPAMLCLCAFGAIGFDLLAGRSALRRWLVLIALGTWALNAYATFWIPRNSATVQARLGWLSVETNRSQDAARAHLSAARAAEPNNAVAALALAQLLSNEGRPDQAIAYLRRMLDAHPDHADGHLKLARLLGKHGQADQAIHHCRRSLQLNRDVPQAHRILGRLLGSRGEYEQEIDHLRQELRIRPDSGTVHHDLGATLATTGRLEAALHHFLAAVRLGTAHPPTVAGAARILATHPDAAIRQPDKAIRLAERAAQMTDHQHPAILDTLAAAYAAAGRFGQAVATAEKALALAEAAEGTSAVARDMRLRLELYRRHEPYLASGLP